MKRATIFVVLLALVVALVSFAAMVIKPPRSEVVTVEPATHEVTSRVLAQPEKSREAVARIPSVSADERAVFQSYVDMTSREIARLRLELDECRYPRDTPLGIAHALPEWPHLDDEERRDVEWFLRAYPVQLAWGEAEHIAKYRAADGGDRRADIIRWLGRERVRATLTPEAQTEFDEMYQ